LLIAGALVGGWTQTLLFAAALLVDWVGVYLTSRQGNWRLRSAGHWTERHGEFIILALGESVVAIGVGAASQPVRLALEAYTYGHIPSSLASWWPPWASKACWRTPVTASRWAPSTRSRCPAFVLYLAWQLLFKRRMHNLLSLPRLVATGVLLAALPAAVVLPPLVGLAGLALILAALIVVETTRYAQIRRNLRGASSPASS
jgi:ABC-type branched-subunit amino acid transport system permease subunit